jgi:hypothetical protein
MNFASVGLIAILVSCVFLLVSIFLLAPLPYIIAAAILKIERRGYWKAFGTAILGGLAGMVISLLINLLLSALMGGTAKLSLTDLNNLPLFLTSYLSKAWLGAMLGWIASTLVTMLIASGLYGVGFGKGALIWLLGLVFSILIGIAVFLIFFVLSIAGLLPSLQNLDLKNLLPGYF